MSCLSNSTMLNKVVMNNNCSRVPTKCTFGVFAMNIPLIVIKRKKNQLYTGTSNPAQPNTLVLDQISLYLCHSSYLRWVRSNAYKQYGVLVLNLKMSISCAVDIQTQYIKRYFPFAFTLTFKDFNYCDLGLQKTL